jgi:hypothetical protein
MAKFKIILLMAVCIFITKPLSACDICGCSSGNYFIGPFPQFNKHFVGMRYSFRNYNSVLKSDNSQFSKDHYQTAELLFGTRICKKWQLLLFVPYSVNRSVTDDGIKQNQGLGDVTLMGSYNLFDKLKMLSDTEVVQQQLWIGGGVKLPTGKFSVDSNDIISSANNQPGTGSFDFLALATYTLRIKNWGLSSNATYKINQSASNFKFGDRFAASAFASRSFYLGKVTLSPNAGLLFENLAANKLNNETIKETGGYTLLTAAGLETRFNRFAIGGNIQIPLVSDLSGGQTIVKVRGMLQMSYVF